jgi:YidC/Oxa1 family membrane protein insertase
MDKRTWLAIASSLLVYYVWMIWVSGNPVPESVEPTGQLEPVVSAPANNAIDSTEQTVVSSLKEPEETQVEEVIPEYQPTPVRNIPIEECGLQGVLSTDGARLTNLTSTKYAKAYDVSALWKWGYERVSGASDSEWIPYGKSNEQAPILSPDAGGLVAGAGDPSKTMRAQVLTESSEDVTMQTTQDGVVVTRSLRVNEDCKFSYVVSWENTNTTPFTGGLWVGVHDALPEDSSYYSPSSRPFAYVDQSLETEGDLEELVEPIKLEGPVSWFGISDNYFGLFVLPPAQQPGHAQFDSIQRDGIQQQGVRFYVDHTLAVGERYSADFQVYAGAKKRSVLKEIDPTLSEAVQLGFFGFFGKILLATLYFFQGFVGNWGVAIICMTVAVKTIFFPLTQMSFKSSQAMSALQPEIKILRAKLKDSPEELNREMMKLWKANGVNPLGGCLPMLIQFPVWIALYQVLLTSVDLYHTKFLYIEDLSSVDPYCIFPAVVVVLMLIQQQMMPTANMDPAQAKMMKMMPLMFGFFFFTFPAGLVIYIFVNMTLTIAQQWVIKRQFNKPAAA